MKARKIITIVLFTAIVSVLITYKVLVPITEAARSSKFKEKTLAESLSQVKEAMEIVNWYYVEDVTNTEMTYGAIEGIANRLDPHSEFLTPKEKEKLDMDTSGEYEGIGLHVTIKDNMLTVVSPIEDTPAFHLGIQPMDRIIKIDKKPTEDMTLDEAVSMMRGKAGTSVTLTISRAGEEELIDFCITRAKIKLKSIKYEISEDGILYLKIIDFKKNTADEIKGALKSVNEKRVEGIILDLRYNPGGLLSSSVEVSELFLDAGKTIVSVKPKNKKDIQVYYSSSGKKFPDVPVIVLINIGSASASEIVAGALKDNKRAIILGERSFGKGSVQRAIQFDDGSSLKLTIAKYYTPSDVCIHGIGIEPEIHVQQDYLSSEDRATIEKIKNGKYIPQKDVFWKDVD